MWDFGSCTLCHWFIVSFVDGIFGADGEALGFWMTTLGSNYWGWKLGLVLNFVVYALVEER